VNDATIAANPLALQETVSSTPRLDETIAAPPSGELAQTTTTPVRTTVLPRVEMDGARPRVVVDNKRRRFDPVRQLGEGGHGEVTGVQDNDIGRTVAIKRLRSAVKASPAAALRFASEVRTVGQLEHPNIVPIHDVGLDENGDYYFVMKYVEGETLEDVIEKLAAGDPRYHAQYGFERRVQIFTGILDAVAFAHAKGILHRDIKPANVMVGAHGEVVLMDWGVAKQKREPAPGSDSAEPARAPTHGRRGALFETRAGDLVGTPAYMAPEQARGGAVDERSDIYSLCLLFHELLSLSHPLAEKTTIEEMLHSVQHEPVPHMAGLSHPHQPPTPAELAWFVSRGLAKDPAMRFQSVQEMLDRLERRAEGDFPVQCPVTFTKRMLGMIRRFIDRHPMASTIMLFAGVLAVVGALVVIAMRVLR
jgi:serine/threonine-protein kinase